MTEDKKPDEFTEIDEPAVVEGVFFRQGLTALRSNAYAEAVNALKRVEHSRHYGAHFYLGVALLRAGEESVEVALTKMILGLEMMLAAADGDLKKTDPSILSAFTEEVHHAVSSGVLSWKNEEFDLEGTFEELNTLVLEVKAQLEKAKLDHGLVTELCCAILAIFEAMRQNRPS